MCKILITRMDTPYPGVRQILSRSVLNIDAVELTPPKRWRQELTRIPVEERYFLVAFLMARKWSTACDILAEHPALVAPWASNFLRDLVLGVQLSAHDFETFCTHIFVLDLAQTLGIGRVRAFLTRLDR